MDEAATGCGGGLLRIARNFTLAKKRVAKLVVNKSGTDVCRGPDKECLRCTGETRVDAS